MLVSAKLCAILRPWHLVQSPVPGAGVCAHVLQPEASHPTGSEPILLSFFFYNVLLCPIPILSHSHAGYISLVPRPSEKSADVEGLFLDSLFNPVPMHLAFFIVSFPLWHTPVLVSRLYYFISLIPRLLTFIQLFICHSSPSLPLPPLSPFLT